MMQMTSWPRMTPDSPRSIPTYDAVVVALVTLGHQRAQESLDAIEIDEDERRDHQHQEQAADAEHDAADELLAVLEDAPALALGRLQTGRRATA